MTELLADIDAGGLYGAATGVGAVVERRENLRGMRDTGQDTYGEHTTGTDVQRSAAEREVEPPPRPESPDPGDLVPVTLQDGRVVHAYDRLLGLYGVDVVNNVGRPTQPELL